MSLIHLCFLFTVVFYVCIPLPVAPRPQVKPPLFIVFAWALWSLRLLGVEWRISAPFYAVGTLLLLACTPKLEQRSE